MAKKRELQAHCHDCGVSIGEDHRPGCDVERCPRCGFQRFSCDCAPEDTAGLKNIPWSGEFPGAKECRALGWYAKLVKGRGWVPCSPDEKGATEDLNRLYSEGEWNVERQEWRIPERKNTVKIICWANGLLEISASCPEGALPLAEMEEDAARDVLNGLATMSHNDEWLVPKSPEWCIALAEGDEEKAEQEAYNSMMNFRARLLRALENRQAKQGKEHGKE